MRKVPIVALSYFEGEVMEMASDSAIRVLRVDNSGRFDQMPDPENPARLATLLADALLVREQTHEVVTEIREKDA